MVVDEAPLLVAVAGGERVGLWLRSIAGVHRDVALTPMAWLQAPWLGLATVRGSAVPVLDVGVAVGGRPVGGTGVVVAAVLGDGVVALAVDAVEGVEERAVPVYDLHVIDVPAMLADPALAVEDRPA